MKSDKSEIEQIKREADAFAAMPEASWLAVVNRMTAFLEDALEAALRTETMEEKRNGFCGRALGIQDLRQEFSDLRSGAWRQWPEFARHNEQKPDEDDD